MEAEESVTAQVHDIAASAIRMCKHILAALALIVIPAEAGIF
jgi:hypothetical protein